MNRANMKESLRMDGAISDSAYIAAIRQIMAVADVPQEHIETINSLERPTKAAD